MNNWYYLGVGIFVFFLFREVLTWYWKTNKIVSLLEQIEMNTRVREDEEEPAKLVPDGPAIGSVWRDGKWVSK